MKLLKSFLIVLAVLIVLFAAILGYFTITDYRPVETRLIYQSDQPDTLNAAIPFTCLSWNVGYGGLGDDMDFFYDGGKQVRTGRQRTKQNLLNIVDFMVHNDSIDFILLQEVDTDAKRTYHYDEYRLFDDSLTVHHGFFALNYHVKFVPVPLFQPMGRVKSGLLTLSRYNPSRVERINFPGDPSWPIVLFELDRCFLATYFPLSNGKELVVINTHNSAFDDGSLKAQEMEYLRNYLTAQYNAGNYIITGGDWNQNPPGFATNTFGPPPLQGNFRYISVPDDYMGEGWSFVYDSTTPTNRDLLAPYQPGTTFTTILDFFLISPNCSNTLVKTTHLGFQSSDHNPVTASFTLSGD